MKQVLDKSDTCGMYENYQRQEGFPVGKHRRTESACVSVKILVDKK